MSEPYPTEPAPAEFLRAVESLRRCRVRPEVTLEDIRPPQRLAPWSHAIGAEVVAGDRVAATGRLVLLGDPDSTDAWDGQLRLVTFASAELDADMAGDPLLADVAWSWLIDALEQHGASYTAAGGTVTQTASARFGDLAGPPRLVELELRGSWTPRGDQLGPHLSAWAHMLCTAAGLPPPGVVALPSQAPATS